MANSTPLNGSANQPGLREQINVKALSLGLHTLAHTPDWMVTGALALLKRAMANHPYGPHIAAISEAWKGERRDGYYLARRALRDIHADVQARLAEVMLVNYQWRGNPKRCKYWDEGTVVPTTVLISPTMRCNLGCRGCYAGTYSQKDDLPVEVFDRVLQECKELGIYLITLLGGEPLVYPDLLRIIAKHSDMAFMMFTNGILVDPPMARQLHRLGNVVPIYSVEGFEEDTDLRRGRGTFRKVMTAMDLSRKEGLLFGFSAMVSQQNVDVVVSDAFNDMLVEKGAFLGWHFLYMPVGRQPDHTLMPTAEQREKMRRYGAARIRTEKPLFVADFWNDAPWVGGCIAGGREYLHINASGDVEPCIFCHFAVDNVKEKSLFECTQSPFFRAIRAHQPFSTNLLRPCMLIDHPDVFRGFYRTFRPHPTHPNAEDLPGSLAPALDAYAEATGNILDPVWETEFVSCGFQPPITWAVAPIDTGGNGAGTHPPTNGGVDRADADKVLATRTQSLCTQKPRWERTE